MNVEQLKERGFFFEPVPTSLTRVGHAEPFRYFRPAFLSGADAIRDAEIAQPHPDGKGFALLTTNSWQQLADFPFAFIMESDYKKLQAMVGKVEAAQDAVQSARERLFDAKSKLGEALAEFTEFSE